MIGHPLFQKIQKISWALFLVCLPVSSFPYFPGVFGDDTQVRPLALYPLVLLVFFVTLPRLLTKKLPRTSIPYIVFVILAIASTIFSLTRDIPLSINISVNGRALRTLATLVIGSIFYFTVSLFPQDREDLRFTLRWLYFGFVLVLIWSSFQIIYVIKFDQRYFSWLNEIQSLVSTRKLFDKRISGMTYEPSWFAEQLTFLLMPLTLASIVSNYSVFRWRFSWLSVEVLLLCWSSLALLFTFSRGGLAIFIILIIASLLLGFIKVFPRKKWDWSYLFKRFVLIGLVLLVLTAGVFLVAQKNNYFSRLWSYWTDEESAGTYLEYIAFSQRFTYWETAYQIFVDNPLMGIGLGNYTFYFQKYLPDRPYRNPELIMKLVPEKGRNQIVTVKNFGLRILAETGVLGASAFLAFFIALFGCVVFLLFSRDQESVFWGRAGLIGLVSFFPVSLSIDSFAIPNMWVVFGLITASAFVILNSKDHQRVQKIKGC